MIFLDAWDSHWVNLLMLACAVILLNPEMAIDARRPVFRKALVAALFLMTAAKCVFFIHNMYIFRVEQFSDVWTPEQDQICEKYWENEVDACRDSADQLMAAAIPEIDSSYMMLPILNDDDPIPLNDYIRSELESYYSRNEDLIEDDEYQALRREYKRLPESVFTPYWGMFEMPWGVFPETVGEWGGWVEKNAYQISFFVMGLICLNNLQTVKEKNEED